MPYHLFVFIEQILIAARAAFSRKIGAYRMRNAIRRRDSNAGHAADAKL